MVGLREERQKVVSILYDIGVLQIEPLSKSRGLPQGRRSSPIDSKEVSEELLRIRSLKAALPYRHGRGEEGFRFVPEVMRTLEIDRHRRRVSRLKQAEDQLSLRLDELKNRIELVTKLSFINGTSASSTWRAATSFFGVLPPKPYQQLLKSLAPMQGVMPYSSGHRPRPPGRRGA